jgi:hypothetical protein
LIVIKKSVLLKPRSRALKMGRRRLDFLIVKPSITNEMEGGEPKNQKNETILKIRRREIWDE